MLDNDAVFGLKQIVSREILSRSPGYWEHLRQDMIRKLADSVLSPIVDDGLYHVLKIDILRDDEERMETVSFYTRVSHSVARVRRIELPELTMIPRTAKLVCRYCGNVLTLDKRGGCSACGGPAGKSYENN